MTQLATQGEINPIVMSNIETDTVAIIITRVLYEARCRYADVRP